MLTYLINGVRGRILALCILQTRALVSDKYKSKQRHPSFTNYNAPFCPNPGSKFFQLFCCFGPIDTMENFNTVFTEKLNKNLILYVPSVRVALHTGNNEPKPKMQLVDGPSGSYDEARRLYVEEMKLWHHSHREYTCELSGIAIPMTPECAAFEGFGPEDSPRCYFVVAAENSGQANQIPLFIRTVEFLVHVNGARPVTAANLEKTKSALNRVLNFACASRYDCPDVRFKTQEFVKRLFMPLVEQKENFQQLRPVHASKVLAASGLFEAPESLPTARISTATTWARW